MDVGGKKKLRDEEPGEGRKARSWGIEVRMKTRKGKERKRNQ